MEFGICGGTTARRGRWLGISCGGICHDDNDFGLEFGICRDTMTRGGCGIIHAVTFVIVGRDVPTADARPPHPVCSLLSSLAFVQDGGGRAHSANGDDRRNDGGVTYTYGAIDRHATPYPCAPFYTFASCDKHSNKLSIRDRLQAVDRSTYSVPAITVCVAALLVAAISCSGPNAPPRC